MKYESNLKAVQQVAALMVVAACNPCCLHTHII